MVMEAAFVILLDGEAYNLTRQLQTDLFKSFKSRETLKLEPHITIKYAFEISNIDFIEQYFNELTQKTKQFSIEINGVNYFSSPYYPHSGNYQTPAICQAMEYKIKKPCHEQLLHGKSFGFYFKTFITLSSSQSIFRGF